MFIFIFQAVSSLERYKFCWNICATPSLYYGSEKKGKTCTPYYLSPNCMSIFPFKFVMEFCLFFSKKKFFATDYVTQMQNLCVCVWVFWGGCGALLRWNVSCIRLHEYRTYMLLKLTHLLFSAWNFLF